MEILDHAITIGDVLYVGGAWLVLLCIQRALVMYLRRDQRRANEAIAIRKADQEISDGKWPVEERTSRILDIWDDLNERDRRQIHGK